MKRGRREGGEREVKGDRKGTGRVCVLCQYINTWILKFVKSLVVVWSGETLVPLSQMLINSVEVEGTGMKVKG